MILVLNLNKREREEFVMALQNQEFALKRSGQAPGREATARRVYEKFCHARREAEVRP